MQPKDVKEAISAARQFHIWMQSHDHSQAPDFIDDPRLQVGQAHMLVGVMLHSILSLAGSLSQKLRLWTAAGLFARIRIRTDGLSYEPRQCGYNAAFTRLGIAELKRGNTAAAIHCLGESAKVWPCPHNTSFGLRTRLARELSEVPQASAAVNEYWQVVREFKA
ncbi:MAG: hypothetical protein ABJ000_05330 [Saccharospirillum sp.]|uniref:hypothetical protein n=1 Tax=Saccharospirillum sp. TaxID=2033801 RepID=UPI003298CA7F